MVIITKMHTVLAEPWQIACLLLSPPKSQHLLLSRRPYWKHTDEYDVEDKPKHTKKFFFFNLYLNGGLWKQNSTSLWFFCWKPSMKEKKTTSFYWLFSWYCYNVQHSSNINSIYYLWAWSIPFLCGGDCKCIIRKQYWHKQNIKQNISN